LTLFFILSCSIDPCEGRNANIVCNGNGTLVTMDKVCGCTCNAGFYGPKCDSTLKIALITKGAFVNNTVSNSNPLPQVNSIISADPTDIANTNKIVISDLGAGYRSNGAIVSSKATITSNTTITLNEDLNGGFVFKGSGVKQYDGTWKFTYTTTYLTAGTTPTVDNNVTTLR
jgi:hypothetical protein